MNFLDKLDFLMAEQGLNKNSLSNESAIPYTTIDGWYKKGYANAKLSSIKKIADFFGTTLDYLIRDEITDRNFGKPQAMILSTEENELIKKYRGLDPHGKESIDWIVIHEFERCESGIDHQIANIIDISKAKYSKIIPLSGKVSAGIGVEAIEQYDTIHGPDNADLALIVDGDSMEPRYLNGDVVYIRQQPSLETGQIGVVQVQTEDDFIPKAYLKKFYHQGDQVRLTSVNRAYDDLIVPVGMVAVLGIALDV